VLCTSPARQVRAVYKPLRGERPLWDFPTATLGRREVATAVVDAALGWGIVPATVWRADGPLGPGSLQAWIDADDSRPPVDVIDATTVGSSWIVIAEGEGSHGDHVCLVHEDSPALRRIALLDALVNNADRKGGHVLRSAGGTVMGIDHGLTFHVEPKLRTVLWGWAGKEIGDEALSDLVGLANAWDDVATPLEVLVTVAEVEATRERLDGLIASREFPEADGSWPALPWPAM
jgi:uncharacterized repeat protein (TIGR03843 family)